MNEITIEFENFHESISGMIIVQRKVLKTVTCEGQPKLCMKKALVILPIFASQGFTIHSNRKGAEWVLNHPLPKMNFTKDVISIMMKTTKNSI